MHRNALALAATLIATLGVAEAQAATPLRLGFSTQTGKDSVIANPKAGTYDLFLVNGSDPAQVTIVGPNLARVFFLPFGEFRKVKNVPLVDGLYTVRVKGLTGKKVETELLVPVGAPLTTVGARVDGTTVSLLDPRTGVPVSTRDVPPGWAIVGVGSGPLATSPIPLHLEGPGVSSDMVIPTGGSNARVRVYLPGAGEYTLGVPGAAPARFTVSTAVGPAPTPPAFPADVLAPKAKITKLACASRGKLGTCFRTQGDRRLVGTVSDPGPGRSGIARVEVQVRAGSGCVAPNQSTAGCSWHRATLKGGRWTFKVPTMAFALAGNVAGLTLLARAIDKQGNEQAVPARLYFKP